MVIVGAVRWESDPLMVIPDELKVRAALVVALGLAAEDLKHAAQARMKSNFDITNTGPGSFFDSLQVEMDAPALTAVVGSEHPGSRLQELGGTIVPVQAQALHWVSKDGQDVFAQKATIPARPYLGPAVEDAEPAIRQRVVDALALSGASL
jgi:phage gpG-like protein